MSISMESVSNSMMSKFNAASSQLETAMKNVDLSKPEGMFEMQKSISKWTMCTQMTSSMIKETGEALKGISSKL